MKNAALIGLGMVGTVYVDAFARLAPGLNLKGVFARSETSRRKFLTDNAEQLPADCKSYQSIDEIAQDDNIDFVVLATPPNARLDIARALAKSGKHILMEKPVERARAAAVEICEICEAADVQLGIVLQHRMRPSALQLSDMIIAGQFGALAAVEVIIPWWRPQSYYDELGRGTYARDGGGVLISQAIHTIDLMLSLTGPVDAVTAMVATTGLHKMESEDFVSAGLKFTNGAVGTLFATTASFPGRAESIVLHFTDASVHLEGNTLSVNWQDGRQEVFGAATTTGAGADPMAFTSDWHMAIISDFADTISNGGSAKVTGREALKVHALIEALENSGKTGQTVRLAQG